MPFGVELPENLGSPAPESTGGTETQTDLAPSGADTAKADSPETTEALSGAGQEKTPTTSEIKEILDLDKHDRFRFAGKEWTRKEFNNAYLMQSDYTRAKQQLAEDRRYADNYAADLRKVIRNPERLDEFKKLYPKSYVEMATNVLNDLRGQQPQPQGSQQKVPQPQNQEDPEVQSMKAEFREWKQKQYQAEVDTYQSWLDNQYETLGKKYPFANTEAVTMRASLLSEQGHEIKKETLEKLFKEVDDSEKSRFEAMYKSKVEKQKQVGLKTKDIGSGGSTPGSAPRGLKTLKEAKEAWLNDLGVSNR